MIRSRITVVFAVFVLSLVLPATLFAAGNHEGLNCTGCHGIHTAKGDIIFVVEPNRKALNPRNKTPFEGVTALCLGCHETVSNAGMGILPVSAVMSHPYGVTPDPKVANVPKIFLRDGKLECVGCHDPHPSNTNFKYLRVDTKGGADMQTFCAICHSSKTDVKVTKIKVFNSMDERQIKKEAPTAQKKPAQKKK